MAGQVTGHRVVEPVVFFPWCVRQLQTLGILSMEGGRIDCLFFFLFWLRRLFVAARGLSLVAEHRLWSAQGSVAAVSRLL